MPHLMPETWVALIAISALGLYGFWGLFGLLRSTFGEAGAARAEAERVRKLKQRNINHLVIMASDEYHHETELIEALDYALLDYRS